jgi:hypothetical protein
VYTFSGVRLRVVVETEEVWVLDSRRRIGDEFSKRDRRSEGIELLQ